MIRSKRPLLLFGLAILLYLPNLMWALRGEDGQHLLAGLLAPLLLLVAWAALFGRWLWLGCLLLVPFAALAPLECFYIWNYRVPSDEVVIASIFATNVRETLSFFGNLLIFAIAFALAGAYLGLVASWQAFKYRWRWRGRAHAWALAIIISLPLASTTVTFIDSAGSISERLRVGLLTLDDLTAQLKTDYPFGVPLRLQSYLTQAQALRSSGAAIANFKFHAKLGTHSTLRPIYVLVVGESSNREHWQLMGYGQATNPELSEVKHLVPFANMVSAWPETVRSVPVLITRKPYNSTQTNWNEPSILRAMHEAGFDTWWISNQLAVGQYDTPIGLYAQEADHKVYVNRAAWNIPGNYDDQLLAPLHAALASPGRQPLFIVLHMMGSHEPYRTRYPAAFAHFNADAYQQPDLLPWMRASRAAYDNSILYTDHILAEVIATLDAQHALSALWFVSDHGETLPTASCPMTAHGHGTRSDYEVAAFAWYSDAWAHLYPDKLAQLRTHSTAPTLSAATFQSVLDMADVHFPQEDLSWSLLSASWKERPRTVNSFWQADFDRSKISTPCHLLLPLSQTEAR